MHIEKVVRTEEGSLDGFALANGTRGTFELADKVYAARPIAYRCIQYMLDPAPRWPPGQGGLDLLSRLERTPRVSSVVNRRLA